MRVTPKIRKAIERDFPSGEFELKYGETKDGRHYADVQDFDEFHKAHRWMRYYESGLIVCKYGEKPSWMGKELAYPDGY